MLSTGSFGVAFVDEEGDLGGAGGCANGVSVMVLIVSRRVGGVNSQGSELPLVLPSGPWEVLGRGACVRVSPFAEVLGWTWADDGLAVRAAVLKAEARARGEGGGDEAFEWGEAPRSTFRADERLVLIPAEEERVGLSGVERCFEVRGIVFELFGELSCTPTIALKPFPSTTRSLQLRRKLTHSFISEVSHQIKHQFDKRVLK